MTNKQMKTLTIGEVIYEVVDEQARSDIDSLKSSTMTLDSSLSQSGKAADAKAVGDAINEINETINGLEGGSVTEDYLPLSGGTVNGNVWLLKDSMPTLTLKTNYGESRIFRNASDTVDDGLHIVDYGVDLTYTSYNTLQISGKTDVEPLILKKVVDGVGTLYPVYGKHNRPFGTYTGDGSQLVRTIEVGGNGNAIIIFGETVKFAIVTEFGSYYVSNNGTAGVQDTTGASFGSGSVSFGGSNNVFNSNGTEYKYIVL